MEDDNWDLHAVVRGCCSAAAPPPTTNSTPIDLFHPPPPPPPPLASSDLLPEPMRTSRSSFEDLHDLCKPFFPKPAEPSFFFQSAAAVSAAGKDPFIVNQPPQKLSTNSRTSSSQAPRSKRKKNQFKKVCQVPAESLSSDIWAWRKYGQKPIKGSPYPRGYYRCSSSKGCLARKQVERNRSNPEIFIVTYTAEHNHPAPTHRNSLAGSTRQKPSTPPPAAAAASAGEAGTSAAAVPSPTTSFDEEEEVAPPQSTSREGEHEDSSMDDEGDDVALSDMAALNDDDFFVGLDFGSLNGGGGDLDSSGDCFLDRFPANFGLSWNAGSTAAAATGG